VATHLRLAAVAWLAVAPVVGAGLASAAPHDLPLGPSTAPNPGPSNPGSGSSHSGLSTIGGVSKVVGGIASNLTTAGGAVLSSGGAAASSIGQQLVPTIGNGRNGTNTSSSGSATSSSSSATSSATGGSSTPDAANVAGTSAPATSSPSAPANVPLVQLGDVANATAAAVADASTAPVTALAAELPPFVGVPIADVAALPGFLVAELAPVVNSVTSTAASLAALNVVPLSSSPRLDSPDRGLGGPARLPLIAGPQQNSGSTGTADVGTPPVQRPGPADHTFAADNKIVAGPAFRPGYSDDLRAAGLGEVAAVAVPGFTGLLVLTGAGGLIGFRQARAGRSLPAASGARFMATQ
jgi:hypothetical protein